MFDKAMLLHKSGRFSKAGDLFLKLSRLFADEGAQSKASSYAMSANYFKMSARRAGEDSVETKSLLEKARGYIKQALELESYWAEYLENRAKIETYIHQTFGCEVSFDGQSWRTDCYKVSRALGLPGISPGMTERLECSICGKDPILCEHVAGRVYDGYLAVNVARDIEFDHVSIVDEPMQKETYVLPEPLTAEKLKQILPEKLTDEIIAGRKSLTCKDLLDSIRKNGLHGIGWSK
jgi:hypothetical protein